MSRTIEGLGRTKLIGEVIGKPSIAIGRGISCHFDIKVRNNEGGYDTYEVIISKGRKPWKLKGGTEVCAVGILQGNRLWADWFTQYRGES